MEEIKNEEQVTETSQNQEEKLFTQNDVDKIVKGRISRVEAKYMDYDALKKDADELKVVKTQLGELTSKAATAGKYEELLTQLYSDMEANIDESKKSLIPSSFSLIEKLQYVNSNKQNLYNTNVDGKQAPTVPNVDRPRQETVPKDYNGYKNITDFATHDPRGYLEWAKKNPLK